MTRGKRILRNIAIGAAALVVVVIGVTPIVVHTNWFRNYVREQIVSAAEEGTGGKVEIGSFDFDVSRLRAVVTNFVIHGTEPAGAQPFVQTARVLVDIRLFTNIHHILDVTYLGVDRPRINVMVFPDGRTNIPSPKTKSTSNKSPLETVVDLAVGHFELTNGVAAMDERRQPLNIQANNVHARLYYNVLSQGYQGQLELEPVYVVSGRNTPVTFKITLPVALRKDRVDFHHASIRTPVSALSIDGSIENMNSPRINAHVNGHVATIDLENTLNLPVAVNAKNVPSEIDVDANASAGGDVIDVTGLRVTLGQSNIAAFGHLMDPNGKGALQFKTQLALGELGRLFKVKQQLGGSLSADGTVKLSADDKIDLRANLGSLDIQTVARAAGEKLPYDGVVSASVEAQGDTHAIVASAHLTIVPGSRGIPVSGRINAEYNQATSDLGVQDSYLALPHSRLTLNGTIGKQLNLLLTTRNLSDFVSGTPVTLDSEATFAGAVTGSLSAPRIGGHLAVNGFSVEGRHFNTLGADVAAASNSATIANGQLTRGEMSANFVANVGLRNWSAPPPSPLAASASIANGDLADVLALAGQAIAGYSGALTATAQIEGTVSNPQGSANIQVAKGVLDNEAFDRIEARVNLADQLVTIPAAYLQSGAGRLNLTAEFHHPRESFTTGTVHAHVESNQVDVSIGTVQVNADMNGSLDPKEFLLTCVNADASAHGLRLQGQSYGDLALNARTTGQTVSYRLTSDFAGSNIQVNGNAQLIHDYPTTADATIRNLQVERGLAIAKRADIPASGILSATAHLSGTYANPQGSAELDLTRGEIYKEPLNRVHARVTYIGQSIDVPQLEVATGSSRVDLTAHYDPQGNARFNLTRGHIDLKDLERIRPGLSGIVDLTASGAGTIRDSAAATQDKAPRVLVSALNANVSATGVSVEGHNYGDAKLTATTNSTNRLDFAIDSNLTGGAIHGRGTADLTGDYPVNAQLTAGNVTVAASGVEVKTDGEVTINGPVMKTDQLNGSLRLTKLSLTSPGKPVTIANQGPVSVALDHGVVRIQNAHLTGPQTDIQVTGTASIKDQTLNAGINANADIGLLRSFDREIYFSGKIVVATTLRGTMSQPLINGQMTLQNAALNYAQLPVGISNANGVVAFNGNSARIQNLTAESGGGKINVTGFAGFEPVVRFGIRAGASNVRVRVQEGVSITAAADVRLAGTADHSVVSGTATIEQVNYAPRSDIGSILTRAAPPVQSASAPSPLLDNMKLDIRVRTSPGLAVQASLAENLSADADLHVRGTASQPGVLGRITISQGQLVFFGSQYAVDTGSISFYNPVRIDPILDVSLETQAKGVQVTLHVTGPVDNMKLSYTSDPPLQFQEIVALLAAGSTPTSDPTILANQPQQPAQGFQQMGESAILGKAVADPVASRLQRVFGLTQFKIDPSFSTGSSVPTASLTLQQRITSNLTFTYVSAINDPNSTIIRIEWAFNPQYSAVATRDQNGIFSINFFYKRQFR